MVVVRELFDMESGSSPRQQHAPNRGSLMQRFGILGVTVKRIVPKLAKDAKPSIKPAGKNRALETKRSEGISSKDWDYIMAITDPVSSGGSSPTREDEATDASTISETGAETLKSASLENLRSSEDTGSEICVKEDSEISSQYDSNVSDENDSAMSNEYDSECSEAFQAQDLNERWKQMRSPPAGHVHNVYCPYWRPGDVGSRPECPDTTFTLLCGNPFTKAGREYIARWEECRKGGDSEE